MALLQFISPENPSPILRLAEQRHWRLIPCKPRSKKPLIKAWPQLASNDPVILRHWLQEHPDCNWGVVCGPESGVFVIDVDGQQGKESLCALEKKYGRLPHTLTVKTGGGGLHLYFSYTAQRIRGRTSVLGKRLDIRGNHNLAIVPPSIHPSGVIYEWVDELVPIAAAPGWVFDVLERNSAATRPRDRTLLPEGTRNDGLTQSAGWLRRKGASLEELERKLLKMNSWRCRPPLPRREVLYIAKSVCRYKVHGPDLLEAAWALIEEETLGRSNEERFSALCRALQSLRPGQEIALPLQRIAELLECGVTRVSVMRSKAVEQKLLAPAGKYIAHRQAGLYRSSVTEKSAEQKKRETLEFTG